MIVFAVSGADKLGLGLFGLGTVLFALVCSMVIPRYRPDFPGRNLGGFLALCILIFAAMLFGVFYFAKETHEAAGGEGATTTAAQATTAQTTTAQTTTAQTTTTTGGGGNAAQLAAGKRVFQANCVSCHTLADAGATGTVGPNLDQLKPDEPTVQHQVENGGGVMPAFKDTLSATQIQAVAAYVSTVAGS